MLWSPPDSMSDKHRPLSGIEIAIVDAFARLAPEGTSLSLRCGSWPYYDEGYIAFAVERDGVWVGQIIDTDVAGPYGPGVAATSVAHTLAFLSHEVKLLETITRGGYSVKSVRN
jgi:hypothetical protein